MYSAMHATRKMARATVATQATFLKYATILLARAECLDQTVEDLPDNNLELLLGKLQ